MRCAITAAPDVKIDRRTLAFMVEALDQQSLEFAEAWSLPYVPCVLYSPDVLLKMSDNEVTAFVADTRMMTIQNDVNFPGALGFHDAMLGVIFSRVKFDGDVSGTMSHEKCEMDGDPLCNVWVEMDADGNEQAKEACDRVQMDTYIETAEIGGDTMPMSLSNYLLPSAFIPGSTGPWDRMRRLTSWNGMTPGGYIILRDRHGNVTDEFAKDDERAKHVLARKKAKIDSRVARRMDVAR